MTRRARQFVILELCVAIEIEIVEIVDAVKGQIFIRLPSCTQFYASMYGLARIKGLGGNIRIKREIQQFLADPRVIERGIP